MVAALSWSSFESTAACVPLMHMALQNTRLWLQAGSPQVVPGRPWAQEYDPRGASSSPRPHHPRISDPAVADRPGAWWDHVQEQQAAGEFDNEDKVLRHAVVPRPPWLPARPLAYDDSQNKNGRHGCGANEMRYMPRTVWQ